MSTATSTPSRQRRGIQPKPIPDLPSIEIDADAIRTEIPEAMQQAQRWLLWRYEPPEREGAKPRKVPYYITGSRRTGTLDDDQDRARLGTLDDALRAIEQRPGFGLGFALGPDANGHHWQGIDLDGTDQRAELQALAERLPGYVERSPSGKGYHAIGVGEAFKGLGSNATGIEAYCKGRYFTVTADAVGGDIEDLSGFVTGVLAPLHSPKVNGSRREPDPALAGESFFAKANSKALASLPQWFTTLMPAAREYRDGYRVASADLGRDLEEDIQADPRGIWDFGEECGKSPINLVIEWGPANNAKESALWLCEQMGIEPAALGWREPDSRSSSTDNNPTKTITLAIDALADDPGAALTDEAVDAWSAIYGQSAAEYERLRAKAKKAGARVAEIDRAIGARSKYAKKGGGKKKTEYKFQSYTSYTSCTDAASSGTQTYTGGLESYTSCTNPLPPAPAALVRDTEKGPRLEIASEAALVVAKAMQDRFAFCARAEVWHYYTGAHWEPMPSNPAPLHEALTRWLYPATDGVGFTPRYSDSILVLIQRAALLPLPDATATIPFRNGQLDVETGALLPTTPATASTWSLPYDYRPDADCPRVKAWLLEAVAGDHQVRELLRAFLAALLRGGAHLQRFLHLVGPGGTGKSTLLRLIEALVGTRNTTTTDLKELEQNKFETASLYGKRAALVTDSDRYGGTVNKLKAITGQDPVRLERKHVQQSGSFIFEGLVFLASNEPLATTDYTSGIERRRVTVVFDRRVSDEEKAAWQAQGGEKAILHAELPGVVNWALSMPAEAMAHIIRNPPEHTVKANLDAMCSGNPCADWLTECCIPDPDTWTQVGKCVEERDHHTGRISYEHQDIMLYPNYLAWCKGSGRTPLSLRRFRSVVLDAIKTLGFNAIEARRKTGQGVQGVRLRSLTEAPFDWHQGESGAEGVGSAGSVGLGAGSSGPPARANAGSVGSAVYSDQITHARSPAHTCADFQAPDDAEVF